MASALLVSRNEPHWGERKVYMRKNPNKPSFGARGVVPFQVAAAGVGASGALDGLRSDLGRAASDDSSSLNRKSVSLNLRELIPSGGGDDPFSRASYVSFDLASFSRRGLKELRDRLIEELAQVQDMLNRIDSRELPSRSGYGGVQFSGGYRELAPATTPVAPPRPPPLNLEILDQQIDGGLKEKRTPKANQFYRSSDFVTGKSKIPHGDGKKVAGNKRPLPTTPNAASKRVFTQDLMAEKLKGDIIKRCRQILSKLMKHKHGWVFNVPVDVVGMGLHDYNTIIKRPMDLGTIRTKLGLNQYASPLDFASDVRLTFNNALLYNPKGHDVNTMAEQLLNYFEQMWAPAYRKYEEERDGARGSSYHEERLVPVKRVTPTPNAGLWSGEVQAQQNRVVQPGFISAETPVAASAKSMSQSTGPAVKPKGGQASAGGRPHSSKQPKPKAKDPNKREMSFEEKQKLSMNLENLPQEKMNQVVQIMRRRNQNLAQHGDEIEVDIDVMDTETLWELDRFVCNCKKALSKMKRMALMEQQQQGQRAQAPCQNVAATEKAIEISDAAAAKKKGEQGDEDVDICGDMPSTNFPPVEIDKDDKDAGYASDSSSSSSSSSGSSSSSDSDSGSSSGSDSEADDARSPFTGPKSSPKDEK